MTKLISVIIPAHNEESCIEKTILSIKAQTYKNFEIIVVCDACKDKTFEIAKKHTQKVYKKDYKNISKTRNYGAKFAEGKILIFMDADTLASKNYFQKVVNAVNTGYDFGCAKLKSNTRTIRGKSVTSALNAGIWLSSATGGNLFITKKLFNKINGFDKNMKRGEDTDLEVRAKKAGGKIVYLKNTYLIHNERRYQEEGYFNLYQQQFVQGIIYTLNKKLFKKIYGNRKD